MRLPSLCREDTVKHETISMQIRKSELPPTGKKFGSLLLVKENVSVKPPTGLR